MEQNPQNALWYVNKKTTSIRQEVINLRLGMILAAQLPHDTFTSFMTSNTLRFIISDLCQFPYNVRHDKVSQPSAWRAQYHSSIFTILASVPFFCIFDACGSLHSAFRPQSLSPTHDLLIFSAGPGLAQTSLLR